jgi:hypothetical protein
MALCRDKIDSLWKTRGCKWNKNQINRLMRRMAKRDSQNAPRKKPIKGYCL